MCVYSLFYIQYPDVCVYVYGYVNSSSALLTRRFYPTRVPSIIPIHTQAIGRLQMALGPDLNLLEDDQDGDTPLERRHNPCDKLSCSSLTPQGYGWSDF